MEKRRLLVFAPALALTLVLGACQGTTSSQTSGGSSSSASSASGSATSLSSSSSGATSSVSSSVSVTPATALEALQTATSEYVASSNIGFVGTDTNVRLLIGETDVEPNQTTDSTNSSAASTTYTSTDYTEAVGLDLPSFAIKANGLTGDDAEDFTAEALIEDLQIFEGETLESMNPVFVDSSEASDPETAKLYVSDYSLYIDLSEAAAIKQYVQDMIEDSYYEDNPNYDFTNWSIADTSFVSFADAKESVDEYFPIAANLASVPTTIVSMVSGIATEYPDLLDFSKSGDVYTITFDGTDKEALKEFIVAEIGQNIDETDSSSISSELEQLESIVDIIVDAIDVTKLSLSLSFTATTFTGANIDIDLSSTAATMKTLFVDDEESGYYTYPLAFTFAGDYELQSGETAAFTLPTDLDAFAEIVPPTVDTSSSSAQ
jgi:hypothetical protein